MKRRCGAPFPDSSKAKRYSLSRIACVRSRGDKLVLLKEGKVAEQGTPRELPEKGGVYAKCGRSEKRANGKVQKKGNCGKSREYGGAGRFADCKTPCFLV